LERTLVDEEVKRLPRYLGNTSQWADSTDVLSNALWSGPLSRLYAEVCRVADKPVRPLSPDACGAHRGRVGTCDLFFTRISAAPVLGVRSVRLSYSSHV